MVPIPAGEVVIYADYVQDGERFELEQLASLKYWKTPGHNDDHIALCPFMTRVSRWAVGVFNW